MWKIQAGIAVVIAVISLIVLGVTDTSYGNSGLRSFAQVTAAGGGLLAVWMTIKALVFGVDGD
jgi:hypothetical protein